MWTDKTEFRRKAFARELNIAVVGLGYVGLNIACLFARSGFKVYGFDISEEKIEKLQRGENYLPEEKWLGPVIENTINSNMFVSTDVKDACSVSDFISVAVSTRATKHHVSYDAIIEASAQIASNLSPGKIIVFESTIQPGMTQELIQPVLERESGLVAGKDFGLAFSPERIDPGNVNRSIWNIPKVIGGCSTTCTELACAVYAEAIEQVVPVSSPKVAEMVKVMENTQRDVNIALTNLFAKLADSLNIDIEEALDAAATKWNFMRLKPSCGVGGACIGEVACMATESMRKNGVDASLIEEARKINESMPHYTVEKAVNALHSIDKDISDSKIAVLGLAYKGGSCDMRNSPSIEIIEELKKLGPSEITVYDPGIRNYNGISGTENLEQAIEGCDCIIIATDHPQFRELEFGNSPIVIDGKNVLKEKAANYSGIGR